MTCIFCAIIAGDAPGHVLFKNDYVMALLSLEGHPLIVPLKHFPSLENLDAETSAAVFNVPGMLPVPCGQQPDVTA